VSRLARPILLLLALALPGAALAASEEIEAAARVVVSELEAWDVSAAREAVDELLAREPDSRVAKALHAQVLFEEGNYAKSAALWDELGAPDEGIAQLARATHRLTKGYESIESKHFVFRYPPGKDALLAPYALEALEKIYEAMRADLGYGPPNKIPIEVYADAKALAAVSTLPLEAIKTSGTIAICKFNRIMFTSPKALVHGYGWLDTLAHEYVHLVISKKSRNSVPIWIHEGLAKYLESRWRGEAGQALSPASEAFLGQELKKDALIPFERMHPSMALLPSQEDAALAYAEVFTAIEMMHRTGGNAALVKLMDELKGGADYKTAVSRTVGSPFPKFMADWKAYLARRRYPKEVAPLSAERRRFTEDEAQRPSAQASEEEREKIRFGDFLEIEDSEGRKLAHLGELLHTRGRHKAAVEEFARAYQRVKNRSPALSNRYALALMKLGDFERAEKLLRASLKPFPSHPTTHLHLGQILMATGRADEAERSFLEVVAHDPFDPRPHRALAEIYGARKDALRLEREKASLAILMGREKSAVESKGVVIVRSHPFARVLLDGVDTGRSTPTKLLVAPGQHVIRLVNEERGFSREIAVEVVAGEESLVEVMLDEAPGADGGVSPGGGLGDAFGPARAPEFPRASSTRPPHGTRRRFPASH
jgi:tetratricopeptide (TPR) repeat protein